MKAEREPRFSGPFRSQASAEMNNLDLHRKQRQKRECLSCSSASSLVWKYLPIEHEEYYDIMMSKASTARGSRPRLSPTTLHPWSLANTRVLSMATPPQVPMRVVALLFAALFVVSLPVKLYFPPDLPFPQFLIRCIQ